MSDPIECSWQSGIISVVMYMVITKFMGDIICNEENNVKKYFILFMIVFVSIFLRYKLFD